MSSNSTESKKNRYYISDPTMFKRVKSYMSEVRDPKEIEKNRMIDDLRSRYKEYGRKQLTAFRAQVLRLYKIALETMNEKEEDILRDSDVGDGKEQSNNSMPTLDEAKDSGDSKDSKDESPEKDADDGSEANKSNDKTVSDDEEETTQNGTGKGDPLELDDGDESVSHFMGVDNEASVDGMYDRMELEGSANDNEDDDSVSLDDSNIIINRYHSMPRVSYIQSIQGMTNNLNSQKKPISITISSDEDEEEEQESPHKKYPNIFSTNGAVHIQRVDDEPTGRSRSGQGPKIKSLVKRGVPGIVRVYKQKRSGEESGFPMPKRVKTSVTTISTIPATSFKLFGGFSKILRTVSELVVHIKETKIYKTLGVRSPRGFLLHGPPGTGKTLLALAIAGELEVPMIRVSGPELVAGVSGESESRIRDLFTSAIDQAPCILFIDEIDAICPPRDTARREMERRIVAQLLTCIDALGEAEEGDRVVIIGATNRPDAMDPALRRAGRFDREVCLGIPDRAARKEILEVITSGMKLKPGLDLESLAAATPGFVGADLKALTSEAAIAAVNRCLKTERIKFQNKTSSPAEKGSKTSENENKEKDQEANSKSKTDNKMETDTSENKEKKDEKPDGGDVDEEAVAYLSLLKSDGSLLTDAQLMDLYVEMEDFQKALKTVQPSAKREGFATVPDVTWDNIGSLKDIRSELEKSIMMPVKYPKEFALLGITAPTGILLCGPPGCGKTLLAKAVANEANINFISVKGPELLNMYVGESERAVRQCFQRARNSQPCVIFFDEIDALCPKRGSSAEGSNATSRVVNQVLTEMDGVEGRTGVFLMAATNRPDMVDPAVLRPGRLDKILFVGLPTANDRADILRALTKNGSKPPMKDVDLEAVGRDERLEGFTGADLAALIKEASLLALTAYIREMDESRLCVTQDMIFQASAKIRPSVPQAEQLHYESLRVLYGMPSK